MQAKDIPELPILEFLSRVPSGTWFRGFDNSVPVPDGAPDKVILAKMRAMIRKGIICGCACGRRGDFRLPESSKVELRNFKLKTPIPITQRFSL